MIVWLSSYPRSGNTLFRNMIYQAFGMRTFSRYDDKTDVGQSDELCDLTGHAFMGTDFQQFYEERKGSPELHFLKTHHPPQDDGPAIYIIRDGRSSVVSFHNYVQRILKREGITLADIIRGQKVAVQYGNWSTHVGSWNPLARPNTLLLRYTDLHERPDQVLDAVSSFLNIPRTGEWQNNFTTLQAVMPEFFRHGSDDKNRAQLKDEDLELFWSIHGPCMKEYGFGSDEP